MNRKLIVTLLRKSIQELEMITDGFLEMEHYPTPHIQLAQRKTEDIQSYIQLLSTVQPTAAETTEEIETPKPITFEENLPKEDFVQTIDNEELIQPDNEIIAVEDELLEITSQPLDMEYIPKSDTLDIVFVEKSEPVDAPEPLLIIDESEVETISSTFENTEIEQSTASFTISDNKEEVIEEKFVSNEIHTIVEETKKSVIGDKNSTTTITRNELLSKSENTISSTLANKKITDIKQAINIGDRFRFQRELFRGNGEDMNKTISYLNQLATINEAVSFLKSKYGWATDNETAEDFYQIVRRRFM